jgi:formylglycine-generating enzyme required for sulfatase activity
MAYDPEHVTDYLYSKTAGSTKYRLDPPVSFLTLYPEEQKTIELEITPPVNYLGSEIFHSFNSEKTPSVTLNTPTSDDKATKFNLDVEIPKNTEPGKSSGLITINTQEKIFGSLLVITVVPKNQLMVDFVSLQDDQRIPLQATEIEVYVSNQGKPISGAKVVANIEDVISKSSEELNLIETSSGYYSNSFVPQPKAIYQIFVSAHKTVVPLILEYRIGYNSVEGVYTYSGETKEETTTGFIHPDESIEQYDQIDSGTEYLRYDLDWGEGDLNIHLYDSQNRHTGFNADGEIETEIPNSLYSGNTKPEWIILSDPSQEGTLKIVVESVDVPVSGETYEIIKNEISPGEQLENTITNTIGMEFVLIPAGEFDMGSPSDEEGRCTDEGPVHHVNIGKAFYMTKYEVTQKQWREIMGDNPSIFKGDDDLPVETVSWDDVQEFIKKLNEKEGTDKYRLPSEAEWEYACRAGTTTRYSFGDDESNLGDYAWYYENSDYETHPVGQKKPNSWGLYDMHGNVWEWVEDCWHSDYNGAPTDGSAWILACKYDGAFRVIRGGSWSSYARFCRSAGRYRYDPRFRYCNLGFRLLKEQ